MNGNSAGSCSRDSSVRPHASHCDTGFCFGNMMEKMEEDLTCPVCLRLYEEPKVLSCAHSLCGNCLEGVIQSSTANMGTAPSSIRCPVCRISNRVMGVHKPKDNYHLKAIVALYIKVRDAPKPLECPVHCEQPLNIFCSSDKKLICGFCATSEDHKEHVIASIGDAYKEEKSSLEKNCQELLQGFERGCDALFQLETKQGQALQDVCDESDTVKAYFENLQQVLEQKKCQILSDLENKTDVVTQSYKSEIDKLKVALNEEKRALEMAKDLEEVSDPTLFLQKIHEVSKAVRYVKDVPLPSASDVPVTSPLANIDTSIWDNSKLGDVDKLCWPPKYPEKKQDKKILSSFWAVCAGVLLLTLILAAFFSGSSNDRLLTFHDSALPGSSDPSHGTGTNAGQISRYMRMIADEIVHIGERCQCYLTDLIERGAEFVSTCTWMKGQKKKILLLGMETKKGQAPSISEAPKILITKEKQTGSPCPTPMSNLTRTIQSQNRDLVPIRFTERQLMFHQHVGAVGPYIARAVRNVSDKVSAYWWIVVQELRHTRERCETYILTFMEPVAKFLKMW